MTLPLPEAEARCLLCDAVFADDPTPGRSVARCRECGRSVYADTTTATIPKIVAPSAPPTLTESPKPVELYDLESATENETAPQHVPAAEPEIPLVQVKKPQTSDDIPEAKPVQAPSVPTVPPTMKLPEWATRRPGTASGPPSAQPTAPQPRYPAPPQAKVTIPNPEKAPEIERPKPQLGKALFVVGVLFVLFFGAIALLGLAFVKGLEQWKINKATQKAGLELRPSAKSPRPNTDGPF